MTHVPDALPEHVFTLDELRILRDAMGAYQATLAVQIMPHDKVAQHPSAMQAFAPLTDAQRAAKKKQMLVGEKARARVMFALRRLEASTDA